ncbi:MAG: hypothetical protein IJ545_07925 [Alphaproteobacteria bacterium]|nr:hypothetical protein [Alphaproteobacteria bacterium]
MNIYLIAAIAAGMLVGAAGASLIVKEKTSGISNDGATFGWLGFFLLLMVACAIGAHCQEKFSGSDMGYLSLFPLALVEIYALACGALLRCVPHAIKSFQKGEKIHYPSLLAGLFFLLFPILTKRGSFFNEFNAFALAVFIGSSISVSLYFLSNIIIWCTQKLTQIKNPVF